MIANRIFWLSFRLFNALIQSKRRKENAKNIKITDAACEAFILYAQEELRLDKNYKDFITEGGLPMEFDDNLDGERRDINREKLLAQSLLNSSLG